MITKIPLSCFIAAVVLSGPTRSEAGRSIDAFVASYKAAKTEIQKRTVCLKLIDAGLLYAGSSMEDLRKVFKQDLDERGLDWQGNKLAIVHFVPPKRSTNPMISDVWTGWYLSVAYREDGTVMHYSLSNESKETSMRLQYQKQSKKAETEADPGLPPVEPPTSAVPPSGAKEKSKGSHLDVTLSIPWRGREAAARGAR